MNLKIQKKLTVMLSAKNKIPNNVLILIPMLKLVVKVVSNLVILYLKVKTTHSILYALILQYLKLIIMALNSISAKN